MESKLEQAARHVERGATIVASQRQLVAHLREKGFDARAAESLLRQFERSMVIFRADLEDLQSKR
jgi:hypothetical protein